MHLGELSKSLALLNPEAVATFLQQFECDVRNDDCYVLEEIDAIIDFLKA